MDLVRLRYFIAAVECRSLARAAEKLNVTQPALSKSLQRLEVELGIKLLDRLPRGISPTEYGELLYAHASLINEEVQQARQSIEAMKTGASGKVFVGAGSSMRLHLLSRACVALSEKSPDTEVQVVGELFDHIMPDLVQGKLDIGVSMVPQGTPEPRLVHEPLYRDQIHPTVRVDHPLTSKEHLAVSDTLDYDWILPEVENPGRQRLEAFFLAANQEPPRPKFVSDSTLFATGAIQNSDLIGWHPTQIIGDSRLSGLVALPIPELTLTRSVGITTRRTGFLSAAARLLIEELRTTGARMIEENVVLPIE
ncbi:MAG: LysR family transcriptional regulator [Roseibium sp.]|uniref:LysR family transcriptional regulator n=1 Tax=Roseibium sp. TaxID=1936156 RepID=UPI002603287B|nr:LysR family transcriptional regulator [Roseibium sp.]MCV0426967.1 LysR family transcriptional regulator [Roseibium sp.]